MNVEQMEQMFRVNVFGMIYAIEAVLPEMLRRGRGHIAGVSSQAASKGLPGESGYCATKAAMNSYLEGLRIQLRSRGIAVTTICPGFVATPMTDVNDFKMPWLMSAEEAARRIVRALERRRKVYSFPWQMTLLMKLARWLPDWIIARTLRPYTMERGGPPMP
jgi:short-subunit dehydrogenase